jgi:hypothetical protein
VSIEGDTPVSENIYVVLDYRTSRSGHVLSWLNMGGPPSNPKYYYQTDSELVPWGKGEKDCGEQSEIEPETYGLQSFGALF